MDSFYERAKRDQQYHTEILNHLHRNPEISFEEIETTRFIQNKLDEYGIEQIPLGTKTGAAGIIRTGKPGKTVLLRADIDALKITEDASSDVVSRVPGVMHACGHDFHTTCVLGTAKYFSELREQLTGNIVFLFQPAEEITEGMQAILNDGLLERLPSAVDMVFSLHTYDSPLGTVVINPDQIFGGKTNFMLRVKGKIGHGALPHRNIDPIVAAAAIITAAQTIVSRNTDPADEMICSFCSVNTHGQDYFPSDEVVISGSIRALSRDVMHFGLQRLGDIATHVAAAHQCECSLECCPEVPPCINHPAALKYAYAAAADIFEPNHILTIHPLLASDDFGILCHLFPSCYFFLGIRPEDNIPQLLHTPTYHANRDALPYGIAVLMRAAMLALQDN